MSNQQLYWFSIVLHGNHAVPTAKPITSSDELQARMNELAAALRLVCPDDAEWIMQGEKGTELGHLHVQCCLHLRRKKMVLNTLVEKLRAQGCNVTATGVVNGEALNRYCGKLDTRVCAPMASSAAYLRKCVPPPPVDYSALFALVEAEGLRWQKNVLKIMAKPVDARRVYWFWSEPGRTGKSTMVAYLRAKFKARVFNAAKASDIAAVLATCEPEERRVICIDLPRSLPDKKMMAEVYNIVEQCKNGTVFSPKYKSVIVDFEGKIPHVFFFANVLPDKGALSEDRWFIGKIVETCPAPKDDELDEPVIDEDAFELDDESKALNDKAKARAEEKQVAALMGMAQEELVAAVAAFNLQEEAKEAASPPAALDMEFTAPNVPLPPAAPIARPNAVSPLKRRNAVVKAVREVVEISDDEEEEVKAPPKRKQKVVVESFTERMVRMARQGQLFDVEAGCDDGSEDEVEEAWEGDGVDEWPRTQRNAKQRVYRY